MRAGGGKAATQRMPRREIKTGLKTREAKKMSTAKMTQKSGAKTQLLQGRESQQGCQILLGTIQNYN
jgi:hypothetical protein